MSNKTETFWEIVKDEFNLLNKDDNWVDCMRQWFVIVSTLALSYYLIYAIREIRKAQRQIDFDQVVLIVELIRVSLIPIVNVIY